MIYLDNNATTIMPNVVKKAMVEWCNMGNPSAGYMAAVRARSMMEEFKKYLGGLCKVDICCAEMRDGGTVAAGESTYKILFNSGASEGNVTILRGVIDSYRRIVGGIPHVVLSAIEHKSLLLAAQSYELRGYLTMSLVNPAPSGHILPEAVARELRPNTALICVMHANNETGAVNNIRKIGELAHKNNIPFHCDTVQTFGKFPINPIKENVDSFCISFHKLHGPPGVGALIVKSKLLTGYQIQPTIFGTQNEGFRGGTENLPGIGASFAATKFTMQDRAAKNGHLSTLQKYMMCELGKYLPCRHYTRYLANPAGPDLEIVFISGGGPQYLPNTVFLAVVKKSGSPICNGKIKQSLEAKGIVVSVGSACNTASEKASHVLYSMGADEYIRKGALRISMGDDNTTEEMKKFIPEFLQALKEQL